MDGTSQTKKEDFTTLQDAQNAVNNYKNNNLLRGGVVIHVEQESANPPSVTVAATDKPIPKKDISVTKVWKDNSGWTGTHPDITIRLLRNGTEVNKVVLPHGEVTYTFTGLSQSDQHGKEYVYSVTEDVILSQEGMKGYETSIEGQGDNFTITNIWNVKDRVQISGEKKWKDMNNKLGLRADTITFVLLQDNKEYATSVASAENGWLFTFNNVPMYHADDTELLYTYTIKERNNLPVEYVTPTAVTVETNGRQHMDIVPVVITNELNPEHRHKINFSGVKIWEDYGNVYKQRPASIEVELLKSGEATGMVQTVTPSQRQRSKRTCLHVHLATAHGSLTSAMK